MGFDRDAMLAADVGDGLELAGRYRRGGDDQQVFGEGAALATVVGVLIEVPVMLWLVRRVNRSRAWYERALA